jgi:hypothetical protein
MKRRNFVTKGGGFLGLFLAGFGRIKEGKMQQQQPTDPKEVFLSRIKASKEEFQKLFNAEEWESLGKLYWEDAVLVAKKTSKVYRGRKEIIEFWTNFKAKKVGRKLNRIQPKPGQPLVWAIDLIGISATGEHVLYDMAAVDICEYEFNPDGSVLASIDAYRHKRTCTTALSEQSVDV